MLIYTIHAQAVEHIKRSHPFRVTLCQIIIDRYDVHTIACERIEEDRQRSHQRFTFTRRHFRNLTLVQNDATKQLHVIMHHIPSNLIAAGHPVILINRLVAFDLYEVVCGCQITIKVCRFDSNGFVLSKAPCRRFHYGECLRHHLIEGLFKAFEDIFLQLIDLRENSFAVFDRCFFDLSFQFVYFLFNIIGRVLHFFLQLLCLCAQSVIIQFIDCRIDGFNLFDKGLNQLHVALRLVAEKFL